ncbi:hypothetical protein CSIM01_02336 [Colletotrichum simmondsii]|uniref:NACHT-NTPase and P-loop NTPases N-terminal domain-containing protein n=1 Tax=Colletotrichum simmondsii TaxID=703756 RepID=A0A135SDU1_9PEZI|nr:hypothetical protein CSIM01_02336 [Colletotrichum simmondsii]
MSGAEIIGVVSGTIAIIDAIIKIHEAVSDASGVPQAFRDAVGWLPLLRETMMVIKNDLDVREDGASILALEDLLESCNKKVQALEKIFDAVKVVPSAPRAQRYASATRAWGKSRQLGELTRGIQSDMQLLAANYSVSASVRMRIRERLEDEYTVTARHQGYGSEHSFRNYGTGTQNIHAGNGDQIVNTGSGGQFFGNFAGPFNLSSSPR